jgi:hypothetical protein
LHERGHQKGDERHYTGPRFHRENSNLVSASQHKDELKAKVQKEIDLGSKRRNALLTSMTPSSAFFPSLLIISMTLSKEVKRTVQRSGSIKSLIPL